MSEAEWEYAARAGTTTRYHYGDDTFQIPIRHRIGPGNPRSPVAVNAAGYPANRFGLYHAHGNVSEWVEDCWHNDYTDAPTDGRAWTTNCSNNPLNNNAYRSGGWTNSITDVRSARRFSGLRDTELSTRIGGRSNSLGFRIARTLPITIVSPPSPLPNQLYQLSNADTETVEIRIRVPDNQVNVSMRLQLDTGGDSIVSIPTSSISFPSTNNNYAPNGYNIRSADFTLTATGVGNTTLTIVITDDAGNSVETNILVEVSG